MIAASGSGTTADMLAGLDYVAQNADQIEVVNASIGGYPVENHENVYETVHEAVSNIVSMGIVFVAGAGNTATDILGFDTQGAADNVAPAAFPEVMAVSAMDPNPSDTNVNSDTVYDRLWRNSNFSFEDKTPQLVNSPGAGMDVTAPGVDIYSTYLNSGYAYATGTSMSTAYASGLVALYIAANGRGHSLQDVINIRQALINNGESQTNWMPDGQPAYFYTDGCLGMVGKCRERRFPPFLKQSDPHGVKEMAPPHSIFQTSEVSFYVGLIRMEKMTPIINQD